MAKSKNNVVTYGLSGKIGDLLVFRQVNGKTVVSKIPTQSTTVSEKQQAHRKRFQQAVVYGNMAVRSAETSALYSAAADKQKGKKPVNVAVADFFNAPDIENINLSEYTGSVGDKIEVRVYDDFAVKYVHISIFNADGLLVEEGEAVHDAGNLWIYVTTQDNENLEGDKIVVTASDLPGNIAREEENL
jgi:hypothetical protein